MGKVQREIGRIVSLFKYFTKKKYEKEILLPTSLEELISKEFGKEIRAVYVLDNSYLEFDEYVSWSNPGYNGGNSCDEVIVGNKKVLNEYEETNQYTTTKWKECKVYPVDGIIITHYASDWTGTNEYTAYITKEYKEKMQKVLEENKKIDKFKFILDKYSIKLDKKLRKMAKDVIDKIKYAEIYKYDGFTIISFYDKEKRELITLVHEANETREGYTYNLKIKDNYHKDIVKSIKCSAEIERYWDTIGFSNNNVFVERETINNLDIEYFTYYRYLLYQIVFIKFKLFKFNKNEKVYKRIQERGQLSTTPT